MLNVYFALPNQRHSHLLTLSSFQLVPATMPRPAIAAIGTQYRRIPIVSIGKDIYNDTRLILSKLSTLYPASSQHPSLSPSNPESRAIERLLETWAVDAGGVFVRACQLIPPKMPFLNDEKFVKDREEYTGRSWGKKEIEAMRPEALVEMRGYFEFLEKGLLSDGRNFVLGTDGPTLADIEGWLNSSPSIRLFLTWINNANYTSQRYGHCIGFANFQELSP